MKFLRLGFWGYGCPHRRKEERQRERRRENIKETQGRKEINVLKHKAREKNRRDVQHSRSWRRFFVKASFPYCSIWLMLRTRSQKPHHCTHVEAWVRMKARRKSGRWLGLESCLQCPSFVVSPMQMRCTHSFIPQIIVHCLLCVENWYLMRTKWWQKKDIYFLFCRCLRSAKQCLNK